MLNKIFIMGRLTRDPELRRTQSGTPVTSFSLAVDRDYKTQSGEKETDFIDVVAWRATAEFVAKYFTKGRMAVVEGRLQIRAWQDKEGNNRRSAEDEVLRRERQAKLRAAIAGLPVYERELFYRKYYYCQSTAQMAAELCLTERAVEGRLYRLRQKLRRLLGGDFCE